MVFARSVMTWSSELLLPDLCATWIVKYCPFFTATMPAAPAMPCGTSSLNEYALSPTPLTGVMSEVARIAVSNASFAMFFGPRATVSVPSGDVHTQPVIVNVTAGITISVGGFTLLPMTA